MGLGGLGFGSVGFLSMGSLGSGCKSSLTVELSFGLGISGFSSSGFCSDFTTISPSEDLASAGFESEACELESDFISSSLGFGVLGVLGGFAGVASATVSSEIQVDLFFDPLCSKKV